VPAAVLQIGERIRTERARRGMSLRALARRVGLSPSLISQIETGKCQPSVSTLYAITTALGVSVQDVFGEPGAGADSLNLPDLPGPPDLPSLPGPPAPGRDAGASDGPPALGQDAAASDRPPAPGRDAGASDRRPAPGRDAADGPGIGPHPDRTGRPAGPAGPVACPGQREVLELDSGVTWERLGHAPGSRVDFLLVTYAPGSCSSPAGRLMRHAGTEYGYLIQGELVATLGSRSHRLGPGDAVSFASATPHSYRNEGAVPAVGVWFVASPDGA
jgi:DNA-binding XRE family transcriptional regulator/quercetin dioxygenase-like cupin family protein